MRAMDVGLGTDLLLKRKNKMLIRKQNKGTNAIRKFDAEIFG
jgi:hypothetical protein